MASSLAVLKHCIFVPLCLIPLQIKIVLILLFIYFLNYLTISNNNDGRNHLLSYERYGFKVEDEFRSGIKSSCCANRLFTGASSIDSCRITFAFELSMLEVGILTCIVCVQSSCEIKKM